MNTGKLNTVSLLVVIAGFLYVTSGLITAYGWPGVVGTVLSLGIALAAMQLWSKVAGRRS